LTESIERSRSRGDSVSLIAEGFGSVGKELTREFVVIDD
jgi:hypothetical protein